MRRSIGGFIGAFALLSAGASAVGQTPPPARKTVAVLSVLGDRVSELLPGMFSLDRQQVDRDWKLDDLMTQRLRVAA